MNKLTKLISWTEWTEDDWKNFITGAIISWGTFITGLILFMIAG